MVGEWGKEPKGSEICSGDMSCISALAAAIPDRRADGRAGVGAGARSRGAAAAGDTLLGGGGGTRPGHMRGATGMSAVESRLVLAAGGRGRGAVAWSWAGTGPAAVAGDGWRRLPKFCALGSLATPRIRLYLKGLAQYGPASGVTYMAIYGKQEALIWQERPGGPGVTRSPLSQGWGHLRPAVGPRARSRIPGAEAPGAAAVSSLQPGPRGGEAAPEFPACPRPFPPPAPLRPAPEAAGPYRATPNKALPK